MVDRGEWSALHPGHVAFRKESLYPLIRGCMDLRVDKIVWRREESYTPTGIRTLDCPSHSLDYVATLAGTRFKYQEKNIL
jgi:hypothetical protein